MNWALAFMVWWSTAVVFTGLFVSHLDMRDGWQNAALTITMGVLWPLTVLVMFVMLAYELPLLSVKRLRQDLHNRGLYNEFQQWMRNREDS